MTQSPYQHQDPRQIDLQRQIDLAQRDEDPQRLARLELQWVHRFGVGSLPQSTQLERSDDAAAQPDVSAAFMDESPTEEIAVVQADSPETTIFETALSETAPLVTTVQTAAVTADFATADLQADPPAAEQLFDSAAGTSSALESVPDPERALQSDQQQPMAADSRFSRFTALLKDCLDDVGRVVDREHSTSSVPSAPPAVPPAAPSPRPVPASGPRRLRRWLAPVDADDLPKAS